ncbi:MAG: restriction endonuclease subunit S [Nitrospirota bacterium]
MALIEENNQNSLDNFPSSWIISTIGECFFEIKNGTTMTQNKTGRGIPVSRIETIQSYTFDLSRVQHVDNISKDVLEAYRYKMGDIALSHINSYEHVGKTALYEGEPKQFIHGMNLLRLRFGHSYILPKYAHYFMQTEFFRQEVRSRVSHAVNQVSINQKNLSLVPIIIAPFNEQYRIVNKLDKLFYKINICRIRLSQISLVDGKSFINRLTQSVLAKAFRGELVPQDPNDEPASVLLERIRAEKAKHVIKKKGNKK